MLKVLTDSVKFLLKYLARSEPDELPLMLELVRERKALIESELRFERMLIPDTLTLPPLLKNLYSLDFMFEETEVVRTYGRLLETLYEAEQSILAKIEDQNTDPFASDL
jgi:hypothetical protein